jgi:hypothetical protein
MPPCWRDGAEAARTLLDGAGSGTAGAGGGRRRDVRLGARPPKKETGWVPGRCEQRLLVGRASLILTQPGLTHVAAAGLDATGGAELAT